MGFGPPSEISAGAPRPLRKDHPISTDSIVATHKSSFLLSIRAASSSGSPTPSGRRPPLKMPPYKWKRPHVIHRMRSLSPLLQLPFVPFTKSLGGWIQGEGKGPPSTSSVHFAWKWALRNSANVSVCLTVSPSSSVGLSSHGPSNTSIIFGLSGAGDPVPVFSI
jgi:hypothetical protein